MEAHLLWMVKWYYLRAVELVGRLAVAPASSIVRALTRYPPETRQRWKHHGRLAALGPLLAHGRLQLPFGLAQGMWLDAAHVDLAGAQTYAMVRGLHEPMVQEALRRTLRPGGVFYDVGANIGIAGLAASRLVGQTGRVVCIEPEPANVEAIHAHVRLNELTGFLVLEAAATSSSGPVEVIAVKDSLWTRLASVGEHPLARARLAVRGVSIDDLVASGQAPPPDVVKVDVEGGELDVLEGMRAVMARHRPAIIVEMHGKTAAVCELLIAAGYAINNLDGPEAPAEARDQIHVLAQPVGSPSAGP